jgi:tRNA A37 threonylcarbamoyltransferase TsaD
MLGLGYPGGPVVEKMAAEGDANRFKFRVTAIERETAKIVTFHFRVLKTAVLREVEAI